MLRWKDYGQSITNLIDRRNARSFAWNLESAKMCVANPCQRWIRLSQWPSPKVKIGQNIAISVTLTSNCI